MKRHLLFGALFLFALGTNAQKKIVILGSSTAAGNGSSVGDSCWAGRLQAYYQKNKTDGIDTVITNLAYPGYVTYQVMPTDFVLPANRTSWPQDTYRNVTRAISLAPDIVIIALPSNDIMLWPDYQMVETMNNFRLMFNRFTASGIRCYLTSAQPRSDYSFANRTLLKQLDDSIKNIFGVYAVDTWNPLVTTDGQYNMKPELLNPDNIHPNDAGHRALFEAMVAKNIFGAAPPPVGPSIPGRIEAEKYTAMSGIQTETTGDVSGGGQDVGWQENNDWMDYSVNVATAGNYKVSFRVATVNTGVQFQLRNAAGVALTTVTVPNTGWWQTYQTITAQVTLAAGQQTLRIVTTDAKGTGWNFNWMEFTLAPNQLPTVNAGTNQTITLPTNTASLNGTATDADGTISSYAWSEVSGPNSATFSNASTAATTVSGLIAGSYVFRLKATDNAGGSSTSDVTVTVNALPGTVNTIHIEAENYTAMSGIQTENTADAGGGKDVGWQENTDWMDYAVNVATAGTYTLNFRVATVNTGVQFQLRNASGTVLTTVTVPNTGWWQTYQTVSAQVTLPAGQQTLRIVTTDAKGSGWNINWWEIAGPLTPPQAFSTRIEAENYTAMSGIQTESTTDAGGGKDVGWQENTDWMDYGVNIPLAGTYTVNFRVATVNTGVQFQLRNAAGIVIATVTVPNTGWWQTYQTITAQVTLPAGQQTLRIFTTDAKGTGWNINWWEITNAASQAIASIAATKATDMAATTASLQVFPNPVNSRFALNVFNDLTGTMKVELFTTTGSVQKQFSLTKSSTGTTQTYLSLNDIPAGEYILKVSMSGWTETTKLVKQ